MKKLKTKKVTEILPDCEMDHAERFYQTEIVPWVWLGFVTVCVIAAILEKIVLNNFFVGFVLVISGFELLNLILNSFTYLVVTPSYLVVKQLGQEEIPIAWDEIKSFHLHECRLGNLLGYAGVEFSFQFKLDNKYSRIKMFNISNAKKINAKWFVELLSRVGNDES